VAKNSANSGATTVVLPSPISLWCTRARGGDDEWCTRARGGDDDFSLPPSPVSLTSFFLSSSLSSSSPSSSSSLSP
jgi:hypothetical protein